jgi:hypothetical protein
LDCSSCVADADDDDQSGEGRLAYYVAYVRRRQPHWWETDAVPIYWSAEAILESLSTLQTRHTRLPDVLHAACRRRDRRAFELVAAPGQKQPLPRVREGPRLVAVAVSIIRAAAFDRHQYSGSPISKQWP